MAFKDDPREILRCSFCNKDQDDVKKLIAGPTVFICDECIATCQEIIDDESLPAARDGSEEDMGQFARDQLAYFSASSAWRHAQAEVRRRYARRLGLDRYSFSRYGLKRPQMLLLRWFAALIGARAGSCDEYSPQTDGRRWYYTRGTERRYRERGLDLDRRVYQVVIVQPDGTESVEEFSDIVPALDRERELDRRWTKEGWRRSETA